MNLGLKEASMAASSVSQKSGMARVIRLILVSVRSSSCQDTLGQSPLLNLLFLLAEFSPHGSKTEVPFTWRVASWGQASIPGSHLYLLLNGPFCLQDSNCISNPSSA